MTALIPKLESPFLDLTRRNLDLELETRTRACRCDLKFARLVPSPIRCIKYFNSYIKLKHYYIFPEQNLREVSYSEELKYVG